jgi:hypothetical protein
MFANIVFLKIFGSTGEAITGDWSRLHEDLEDLYSQMKDKMGGAC